MNLYAKIKITYVWNDVCSSNLHSDHLDHFDHFDSNSSVWETIARFYVHRYLAKSIRSLLHDYKLGTKTSTRVTKSVSLTSRFGQSMISFEMSLKWCEVWETKIGTYDIVLNEIDIRSFFDNRMELLLKSKHSDSEFQKLMSQAQFDGACKCYTATCDLFHKSLLISINPYPRFFGTITERHFWKKIQSTETYTKPFNVALWIFFRKTRSVMVPHLGFFPRIHG